MSLALTYTCCWFVFVFLGGALKGREYIMFNLWYVFFVRYILQACTKCLLFTCSYTGFYQIQNSTPSKKFAHVYIM